MTSNDSLDLRRGADTIRVVASMGNAFQVEWFDETELQDGALLCGQAAAGRGNTWFFKPHDHAMVLRHYRRGGFIQHFSERHYLWTGLESTRAMREFAILHVLEQRKLPVSPVVAARVQRSGLRYRASLITRQVEGQTLALRLGQGELDWRTIGRTIAEFHAAGVCHADLNAHNILIDHNASVTLLDFDRARLRNRPRTVAEGWSVANLKRLHRSLQKLSAESELSLPADAWMELKDAWRESLMEHQRSMRK